MRICFGGIGPTPSASLHNLPCVRRLFYEVPCTAIRPAHTLSRARNLAPGKGFFARLFAPCSLPAGAYVRLQKGFSRVRTLERGPGVEPRAGVLGQRPCNRDGGRSATCFAIWMERADAPEANADAFAITGFSRVRTLERGPGVEPRAGRGGSAPATETADAAQPALQSGWNGPTFPKQMRMHLRQRGLGPMAPAGNRSRPLPVAGGGRRRFWLLAGDWQAE